MKQWSEDNGQRIILQHSKDGIAMTLDALKILCGSSWTVDIHGRGVIRAEAARKLHDSPFTAKYQDILLSLYLCYVDALDFTGKGQMNLTKEDIEFFNANPGYFIAPDGKKMPDLTGNVDSHFEFIARSRRVAFEYIFAAANVMSVALQKYVEVTKTYTISDFYADITRSKETFVWNTSWGSIWISGFGNDTYQADANFIIDLGGDDTYYNNAGGCDSADDGIALCVDHSGNDKYFAENRNYVQGFGFLGTGFLIDLSGNDLYQARHFVQGAGIMGVGVIWDLAGNDSYSADAVCQGAAMLGLGMLLDDSGSDSYDCATLGQGGATTLGLGVLSDLEGNDSYQLGWTEGKDALGQLPGYGQGGALSFRHYPWRKKLTAYGGVGMLLDANGNDKYLSKGWCVQGGSYIMSLGVLIDYGGDDEYKSSCGQGSGIHVTNAILIDKSGNDVYEGEFRNGGSGGDRSPGFLIDYQGNDVYRSKTSSYGTGVKPFSYSLFIDYEGDDTYICPEPKGEILFNNWDSYGGVWPESEPYLWPYAICLDLDGRDDYQVRNRKNNSERHSFGHGIHIDTKWQKGDVIGVINNPLAAYKGFKPPAACRKSRYFSLINQLTDPNTFIRFQAIGKISNVDPDIISSLVDLIMNSDHRQVNRDVLECLHYFFVKGNMSENEIKYLLKLLQAKDKEVRLVIADDFGIWGIAQAEDELIKVLREDTVGQVRRFALRSLLELKSIKAVPLVRSLALNDPSEDVRRIAARYLSRVTGDTNPYPILAKVLDKDPSTPVKTAAAEAIGYLQNPQAIELLRKAAKSVDVYLQRAAGKALAEMDEVEGIGILIKSLSFPSIDAFYNYDRNIPNYIAGYTNYDFPDSERYNQEGWQKWYKANKKKIDIKTNVVAFRELQKLTDTCKDSSNIYQIEKYEELLKKFPRYQSIVKLLAAKLNEVAWGMVTAAKGTPNYDPVTGLKYALRATELGTDPNYYDTLVEAYVANSQIDDARRLCDRLLKKYPDQKLFQDRREKLKEKR